MKDRLIMVIMTKSGLGIASFSLAAVVMTTGLGCATGGESAPTTTAAGLGTVEEDTAAAPPHSEQPSAPDGRSGLVRALEESGPPELSHTHDGTDSALTIAVPKLTPELRQRLVRFGDLYLSFDYRADPALRLDGLADLVNPTLLDELRAPLPPALAETLVAEQRTVVADLDSIVAAETLANGDRAYRLRFDLTESDAVTEAQVRVHTIIVIVAPDDTIREVR